jgi:hypothetical protein
MSSFSLDYVCPDDFENLAVEISYDNQIICRVNNEQKKGITLDFFYLMRIPVRPLSVPLAEFLQIIDDVSKELTEIRKEKTWRGTR